MTEARKSAVMTLLRIYGRFEFRCWSSRCCALLAAAVSIECDLLGLIERDRFYYQCGIMSIYHKKPQTQLRAGGFGRNTPRKPA